MPTSTATQGSYTLQCSIQVQSTHTYILTQFYTATNANSVTEIVVALSRIMTRKHSVRHNSFGFQIFLIYGLLNR